MPKLYSVISLTCLLLATPSLAPAAAESPATDFLVYFGTYTGGQSQGIYFCRFNTQSGLLSDVKLAAESHSPSFLAIHPNRQFLYAVNEIVPNQQQGMITAFAIDPQSGELHALNSRSSQGTLPCHLIVNAGGTHVLAVNYGTGSAIVFPIQEDGRLSEESSFVQHTGSSINPNRQEGPHAHSINLDASNRFAVVADLGVDKVFVYRFDEERGKLAKHNPPSVSVEAGSGPRHFVFHPSGRYAYVINEITATVTAMRYDPDAGVLSPIHTLSTVPSGYSERKSTAEVRVHPNGRFLYGSNRGDHHSIVVFQIDQDTGRLTHIENEPTGGRTPRNFNLDPSGRFLLAANQSTDNVVVFAIDPVSGELSPTGNTADVPSPVCIRFLPID